MTTKGKICTGFLVVILLLGLMAFFGLRSLRTASGSFTEYSRLSNLSVHASDLAASLVEALYWNEKFLGGYDPSDMDKAGKALDETFALIARLRGVARLETTLSVIAEAEKFLHEMQAEYAREKTSINQLTNSFQKNILPELLKVDELFLNLNESLLASGNDDGLHHLAGIWKNMGRTREKLTAFVSVLNPVSAREMLEALENARKNVEDLGGALASEKEKRGFFVARSAFLELSQALPPLVETGALAFRAVENARAHGRAIQKIAVELSRFSDRIMLDMGTSTLQGNESAQGQLLILCFAGLLLGIGFATYTSLALARILRKMALYAGDIAAGNFASSIDIREKGEIGAMFQAMRRIPEIFTGVVTRCNVIADYISTGLFRDRLDTSRVSGGFQDLTRSINAIADAYTGAIDNLPVGIITLDAEHKTRFTNSAGGKMVGDDALRAFGGSMPLVDACLHENEIKSAASELTALTGKKLSLAATVLPLRNLAGKTVSGLAVLADITEIREKQALMLEVAGKAAIIADRVAAAAEELAAQVEEISRGAEVQRTRVESTVSAMVEMNSTVAEVAHNASSASDQSRQTRENAVSGSALVNKVVGSINRMNEVAVQLQANMHTLGEQAEGIGTVMNVISDIADQTNLLALNAAIEAARAGEAGRGFAVVADEVRKLAEKTMNATREVGESISAIQSSTRTNIDDVAVAVESVHEATELANSSGEALHDIVNLAESTSSVVSSIAAAADEQSAASEEITQAVGEINRLVTETTEGMLQSSEAVQDLSRIAQELRRVMEELK